MANPYQVRDELDHIHAPRFDIQNWSENLLFWAHDGAKKTAIFVHFSRLTPDPRMWEGVVAILRPGGDVLLLSYYDELRTPYVDLFVKEVNLLVAREWAHDDLLAARDLLASGAVGVGALADHVVPANDYKAAYHTAFHDPSIAKVILQWA